MVLDLPGDDIEYVAFSSDQTLLDADIVLFTPSLGDYQVESDFNGIVRYNGRAILSEHSSFATKKQLDHWRAEIVTAVNAGKIVIVYLAKPVECYRYTGDKKISGTGRGQVTNPVVVGVNSYEAIPNLKKVAAKSGREIQLAKEGTLIASYWAEFSSVSPYEVDIEGEFTETLLKARVADRTVGAAVRGKQGTILFLPPIQFDEEAFSRPGEKDRGEDEEEEYWTDEAVAFGKRVLSALIGIADNLKKSTQDAPPPTWVLGSRYRLEIESSLESAIAGCASELAQLQERHMLLEGQLEEAGAMRRLLFEQGRPLEDAIREAMTLLGFQAEHVNNGESEFDVVLTCPEGRCLGEAEGKDKKAIGIEKFSQLERNIHEDFTRDGVEEYAKAVLFGNAYRLLPVEERGDFFTTKCISAAKRVGAALVRTPDLFEPARYLKEHPADLAYAKMCRVAIMSAKGEVVVFPAPPADDIGAVGGNQNAA